MCCRNKHQDLPQDWCPYESRILGFHSEPSGGAEGKCHDERIQQQIRVARIWQRDQSIKGSSDPISHHLNQVFMFGCNRGTWKFSFDRDITASDVDELEKVNESIGELLVEAGGSQFKGFS